MLAYLSEFHRFIPRSLFLVFIVASIACVNWGQAFADRIPLQASSVTVPQLPAWVQPSSNAADDYLLIVKFIDLAEVRTNSGTTYSMTSWDISDALSLAALEDASFNQVLSDGSCPELSNMIALAEQRSEREQRDVMGIHRVEFSAAKTAQEIADLGNDLLALPEVEIVAMISGYPSLPPGATSTPDFTSLQKSFFGPDPGANFDFAHKEGLTGFGIRVTEMSITWDEGHEDLINAPISIENGYFSIDFPDLPGLPSWVEAWLDHGSATLGILFADENSYGTTGVTIDSDGYLYPVWYTPDGTNMEYRWPEAYCNALADSATEGLGNVVYIEYQTDDLAPIETEYPIFVLTEIGTDAGVVVLAAAGNGGNNLDGPSWSAWRDWGDSGAIIVGAGSSDKKHNRLSFSSYGERIGPQGWGEDVVTLGYGHLFNDDPVDPHRRYTDIFGGTSSATPMVTAAAILVQEHTIAEGLTPLDSVDMRSLLTYTGTSQGTDVSGNIGPFINVRSAMENFDIYDLAVETVQDGNAPFTTYVINNGPRVARDVHLEIVYTTYWTDTLTIIEAPEECEPASIPGVCPGNSCGGILECEFEKVLPGDPIMITIKLCGDPNIGGTSSIHVISEVSSAGELMDQELSNNTDETIVVNGSDCEGYW